MIYIFRTVSLITHYLIRDLISIKLINHVDYSKLICKIIYRKYIHYHFEVFIYAFYIFNKIPLDKPLIFIL